MVRRCHRRLVTKADHDFGAIATEDFGKRNSRLGCVEQFAIGKIQLNPIVHAKSVGS